MMAQKISTVDVPHEEWLALRRNYIGGSDAAAILGLTPYSTPYSVWADKTGRTPPKEDNEAMRQGRDLEDYVAKRWEEATGKKVRRSNYMHLSETYPFAHANVDRMIVGERAGLECKTTSVLNLKKFKGGSYPSNYYTQCVHYMAVTGADRWYLAVLVLGQGFYHYTIERDEDEILALMLAEQLFWKYVQNDTPPPVDGLEPTEDAINQVYAEANPDAEEIDLFALEEVISLLELTKKNIKELETLKGKYEQQLKTELGNATLGRTDQYAVRWTPQTRRSFDTKALLAEYPDLDLEPFYKTTTFRKFEVKEKK